MNYKKQFSTLFKRLTDNYKGSKTSILLDGPYIDASLSTEELATIRYYYNRYYMPHDVVPAVFFKGVDLSGLGMLYSYTCSNGIKWLGSSFSIEMHKKELELKAEIDQIILDKNPNIKRIPYFGYIDYMTDLEKEVGLDTFSKLKQGDEFKLLRDTQYKVIKITAKTMMLDINGEVGRIKFTDNNNGFKKLLRDMESEVYFEMSQRDYFGDLDTRLLKIYKR